MLEIESSSEKELLGFFKKNLFFLHAREISYSFITVDYIYICKWQQLCHPITILPEKLCLHQGKVRGV